MVVYWNLHMLSFIDPSNAGSYCGTQEGFEWTSIAMSKKQDKIFIAQAFEEPE